MLEVMNEIRFPYKPKIVALLVSIAFFVGCGSILANVALNNSRGLILNGIVELSADGATIFYWCLTVASGIFVLVGAIAICFGLATKREIIFTRDGITSPKGGVSTKIISVSFSEITDLNIQSVQKQRFLNIFHRGGKLTISQSMLPDKQAFDELVSLVAARVDG
jgi:hypothetical protein